MDRDLKLKHFANALFSSIYREYNTTFDLPVKLPQVFSQSEANGCSEEERKAVLKLCVSFRSVFNGVFAKAFSHIQKSVKHFMTFLTSRCLKLCGEDLFLSFVIICAFISELNLFCCINGCYMFMSTAPRCLTAIFNRKLKREFYARGGWDRLQLFCENFVQMNKKVSDIPEDSANGDVQHSVKDILLLLEENSSSEEETESSASSGEEMVEDGEEMVEDEEEEEEGVSEESEESMSSEDESDSSESESSEESEVESLESGEIVLDIVGKPIESDEESESSEESDPSSMTEDDVSESDDSQSDSACNTEQTNCFTPIMQENLSIEKKIL